MHHQKSAPGPPSGLAMRLLFNQGTPMPLRNHLPYHTVETAYERGWHDLKNGELLARAEAEGYEALVTTDQNIHYQQNLAGRRVSVLVLMTTSRPRIRGDVTLVAQAIDNLHAGGYQEIAFP
jgi:predicted nuclease of predicted toxin-antitoxin system